MALIGERRRYMVMAVAAGPLVLVAVVVSVLLSDDGSERGEATEPIYAKVTVRPELKSGTRFSVAYGARDAAHGKRLRPASALAINLNRDGETIYVLNSGFSGEPHVFRPGEPITLTTAELIGPISMQYTLPDLEDGSYQLCGVVEFDAADTDRRVRDEFCKTIEVVAG